MLLKISCQEQVADFHQLIGAHVRRKVSNCSCAQISCSNYLNKLRARHTHTHTQARWLGSETQGASSSRCANQLLFYAWLFVMRQCQLIALIHQTIIGYMQIRIYTHTRANTRLPLDVVVIVVHTYYWLFCDSQHSTKEGCFWKNNCHRSHLLLCTSCEHCQIAVLSVVVDALHSFYTLTLSCVIWQV